MKEAHRPFRPFALEPTRVQLDGVFRENPRLKRLKETAI